MGNWKKIAELRSMGVEHPKIQDIKDWLKDGAPLNAAAAGNKQSMLNNGRGHIERKGERDPSGVSLVLVSFLRMGPH